MNKKCYALIALGVFLGIIASQLYGEVAFIARNWNGYQNFRQHAEIVSSLEFAKPEFSIKK